VVSLADDFERDMRDGARRCREFGYNPTYWQKMVSQHGAVDAAKRLLKGSRASDGFTRLWEEGRLDLSVEFFILLPKYADLFTSEERAEARRRLELYEFEIDSALAAFPTNDVPDEGETSEPAVPGPAPDGPEVPVVTALAAEGSDEGDRPTLDDLNRARQLFGTNEPRDVFYRAATYLVAKALDGDAPVSVSEALSVLLQTWNRSYYQYRPVTAGHYQEIDDALTRHSEWLQKARGRSIDSWLPADASALENVLTDFEGVLGPVGAAKALHLLAPRFLPLWDRAITVAYGLPLGSTGSNGARYVRFALITKKQAERVSVDSALGRNVLKAIDEYNYCRFTKGWM
jgi:hypothetical protein